MTSTIKVDTISENTSANGVAVDGVTLKDGGITAVSVVSPFISLGATSNTYQTVTGTDNGNDVNYRAYANHIWKNVTGASSSTDGTERMRLTSSGLGIGESSPDTLLHLKETINVAYSADNFTLDANALLKLENPSTTGGAFSAIQFRTGSGADLFFGGVQGSGNAGDFVFARQDSSDLELMRIASNGQVMISGSATAFDTTGAVNGLQAYYETDSGLATIGSYSSGGSTALTFHTSSGGNASAERMRIADDGDVGIGTTSPTQNFEVVVSKTAGIPTNETVGSSNNGAACGIGIHNESNSAAYSGIALETRTSGASRWLIANEWQSTYNGDLVFRNRNGASSSTEVMRLTSGGIAIGGTGSANTLDDYEEGNWTPSLAGTWNSNPTNMSGKYRKIGQIVTLSMIWQNGAKGGATAAHFTSLPFAPSANSTAPVSDTSVHDNGIVLCDTGGRIFTTANSFGSDNNYLTVTYISN